MMPRRAMIFVALAAGLVLAGATWTQSGLAATQTNLDTNTLPTGITAPAADPVRAPSIRA